MVSPPDFTLDFHPSRGSCIMIIFFLLLSLSLSGTLVLYRHGTYQADWWPGQVQGLSEFKQIPKAKRRKGLAAALKALETLPPHSFEIVNFEGRRLATSKNHFYTMYENGF